MHDRKVEIVLVEDSADDAELVTRVLRKQNLANGLLILKDGAEALDSLLGEGGTRPRAIFLDWKLPKVSGMEVLRRLKADERTKSIPVIVLTSSQEERDLADAYRLGANSYVTKPINFVEFANAVAQLGTYWLMLNRSPA